MVPLNQSYRIKETLEERTAVARHMYDFVRWAKTQVRWIPHDFHPSLGKPGKIQVGRSYDAAITLASIDFAGMSVLEIGARASFLGAYLTGVAETVHVTDLFGLSHPDLGDLEAWTELWTRAAPRPDRLRCLSVDMRATGYIEESFDAVLCISAIEHVTKPPDGDIKSANEMGRLVKPGGYLVIGTDLAENFRQAGGYYYDEEALWERIIRPSGCEPFGEIDLSWEKAEKRLHKSKAFFRSECIFVLRKKEREAE